MTDDLEILSKMIRYTALASVEEHPYGKSGKKVVILEELNNEQQVDYSVKIQNAPDEILAIKADKFPAPKSIFRNDKHECKRADYILIAYTKGANWIIYIELKGGQYNSHEEIRQQLDGAKCLIAYCRAVGRTFWQQPKFLEEKNYKQRFVCVKNLKSKKTPTRNRSKPGRLHNNSADMRKIDAPPGQQIQFNQLIDKR